MINLIEITATIFGFICVWLTIKQHIWCWPTGLIQVSLYILVFHEARLYSDMLLHVIYVCMSIFGWYNWLKGGADRSRLSITTLSRLAIVFWTSLAVAGTVGLGYFMHNLTNADLPYLDATATVLSLIAQWLMAKKVLDSWLIWIAVDVLSVGMYLMKHLWPTAILYAAFLIMATLGFLAWQRDYRKQPA